MKQHMEEIADSYRLSWELGLKANALYRDGSKLSHWGGYSVHRQWERFGDEMSGLFDFGNLWIVGLLWIGLKAFHECWHGLVCRYFGGAVPEAGVTLLLLTTPLGYVNASSSAGFHSKWQRIAVAGAGIYGELFLAAVAAVVWSRVEPGAFGAALHQVVVLSSFTTLLFNANPLMRFDGYYIFSDLLDIPNLYSKGQASSRWLFRRWVLGIPQAKSPLRPTDKKLIIGLYGVAAAFWRVLVVVGLLAAAALLFEGAGLVLALVAGAGMAIQGLGGMVHYLRKSASAEGMRPSRLLLRATALAALLVGALCLIRVTPSARAPAVIQNAGGGEIRSQCPGFLTEIAVANGQAVEEGRTPGAAGERRGRSAAPKTGSGNRPKPTESRSTPQCRPARRLAGGNRAPRSPSEKPGPARRLRFHPRNPRPPRRHRSQPAPRFVGRHLDRAGGISPVDRFQRRERTGGTRFTGGLGSVRGRPRRRPRPGVSSPGTLAFPDREP